MYLATSVLLMPNVAFISASSVFQPSFLAITPGKLLENLRESTA